MIEVNLDLGNTDEQFFHLLANAYLADPGLLSETISAFSETEIQFLAKAISYDLQKTDRVEYAVIPGSSTSVASEAVARLIYAEAHNTSNASLSVFEDQSVASPIELQGAAETWISTPVTSTTSTTVFTVVSATMTLSTSSTDGGSFTVKLYKHDGKDEYLVRTSSVTIAAGSTGMPVLSRFSFNATGQYTLYARVYDSSGTLVTTSSSSAPVTVTGRWRITVELPDQRQYKGTLTLYNASGERIHSCECLGRSVSNDAPDVLRGNTPTGECIGYLAGPDLITYSYGYNKYIRLDPVSGDMKDFTWRSGFLIHGGDPSTQTGTTWYPLRPTNGCIRVSNADQAALEEYITDLDANYHDTTGDISITEFVYSGQ